MKSSKHHSQSADREAEVQSDEQSDEPLSESLPAQTDSPLAPASQEDVPPSEASSSDDIPSSVEARSQDEHDERKIEPRPEEPVLDSEQLSEDMRIALRLLTQPVVLVTTRAEPSSAPPITGCRGVTISSFTTVTLKPSPIISFNLKLPSRTWFAMSTKQNNIRIHILDATPQGAAIAHTFTQPYDRGEEPFFDLQGQGVSIELPSYPAAPLIGQTEGVLAHIHARVGQCMGVGDHMIVTAQVLECELLCNNNKQQQNAAGLSYAAQGYRGQGGKVPIAFSPAIAGQDSSGGGRTAVASAHRIHAMDPPTSSFPTARQHRALAMSNISASQSRSYSTKPNPRQASKPISGPDDGRDAVDPAARKMTVGDFLNVPEDDGASWRFPHVKSLVRADRAAKSAAQRLKDGPGSGVPHSRAQVEELENEVRVNERMVDKKLSKSAARSLGLMLDKGRVDFKRAQWLESSVERGQAVLAEDMKQVDAMYRQDQIDEATFHTAKQKLEADYDALVTETMRLRQVVDEEGDGPAFDPEEGTGQGRP